MPRYLIERTNLETEVKSVCDLIKVAKKKQAEDILEDMRKRVEQVTPGKYQLTLRKFEASDLKNSDATIREIGFVPIPCMARGY